jgi:ADP-ribose pyrophosphatase
MAEERALPETIEATTEFESHVFDVVRARIRFPDGHEAERVVVEHPGAVALIVLDEEGRWLLVRQYRHPARRELLEVPAGTRDGDEPPEATAEREVREETGYSAGSLVRIGGAWMAPGFTTEYMHFYVASQLHPDPLPADDDEYLSEPVAMTLDEVYAAVESGAIEDAKTIAAVTLYERWRKGR